MSVSEGADEEEARTGGNGYEEGIFEEDFEQDGGIDPMESLNILRGPQFLKEEADLTEDDEDEEEDIVDDLRRSKSSEKYK